MQVGIIGLGDRSAHLIKAFAATMADFHVVAYADPSPSRLDDLAQSNVALGQGYARHTDMLAECHLDWVIVCSPNHLHLQHIGDCLRRGLRVFTEKPVVRTVVESFAMLDLLKVHGVDSVMVGMVLRYAPLFQALCKARNSGQLGEIMSIEAAEHIQPEHGAFFHRDWRRKESLSGGFLLEKCCHDLDLYQGLIGSRARRVASFGGRRFFHPGHADQATHSVYRERASRWGGIDDAFNPESDLIDNQVALIEYENGVNLAFHTNQNVPNAFRRFCVVGTRGTAEGDFVRDYLRIHDSRTGLETSNLTFAGTSTSDVNIHYGAEERMARGIEEHLLRGVPLPVSALDALTAGLTAMKIDEARRSGRVLDLTEMWRRFDDYQLTSAAVAR